MKLTDLQEARYYRQHPVVDFIDDVQVDEIRSHTYPIEDTSAIIKSITDKWGKPKGKIGSGYTYWSCEDNGGFCNIALQHEDEFTKIEVSKG